MKIKIAENNVCYGSKIHNANDVVELPDKDAQFLIKGKHAVEHKEEPPKKEDPKK